MVKIIILTVGRNGCDVVGRVILPILHSLCLNPASGKKCGLYMITFPHKVMASQPVPSLSSNTSLISYSESALNIGSKELRESIKPHTSAIFREVTTF